MKRLLLILLCLLMVLSVTACGENEEEFVSSTTETQKNDNPVYAGNKLINRFFVEFTTAYPNATLNTDTILRGKDTTEYTAVIDECRVTVRDASYDVKPDNGDAPYTVQQLRFMVEGGLTEQARDNRMSAFSKIARVIDSSCTKQTADEAVAHLEKQTKTVADYRFCPGLKVERYIPIVKEHNVPCRIDLVTINYLVKE